MANMFLENPSFKMVGGVTLPTARGANEVKIGSDAWPQNPILVNKKTVLATTMLVALDHLVLGRIGDEEQKAAAAKAKAEAAQKAAQAATEDQKASSLGHPETKKQRK